MKKILISMGIIVAATISLTNCKKEAFAPQAEGQKFTILADASSKTAISGLATTWVEGDDLTVFHAEAGTTEYGSNDKFTLNEGNAFEGTLTKELTSGKSYDWYVMYPYVSLIETPANTTKGYTTIGSSASGTQTQAGNDNKSHLAGSNVPLYGKATDVAADATPSLLMHHAASVVEVKVTNTTDEPLTVSSVSFTAPEAIVGTYYIDFSGASAACKVSNNNYVSNTANLNVTSATELTKNATASFYLVIKPFVAAAGSELELKVNGYSKKVTLTSAASFNAGKIKTLEFDFNLDTSVNLADGEYVILAKYVNGNNTEYYAMQADATKIYCPEVNVSAPVEGATSYTVNDESLIWTLTKNTEGDGYSLKHGTTYIQNETATKSNNNAKFGNDPYYFDFVNTNGTYQIVGGAGNYPRKLAYNHTYKRFALYLNTTTNSGSGYVTDLYIIPATLNTTKYTIAVSSADETMGTVEGGGTFAEGKEVTVKATAKDGYKFSQWTENGTKVDGAGATYTFTVTGNRTLIAEFEESTGEGGSTTKQYTLQILPTTFTTKSYADNNKDHTLTAKASDNSGVEVTIATSQIYQNSSKIQGQKNNASIQCKTDLGEINSIVITSEENWIVSVCDTQEGTYTTITGSDGTYAVPSGNKYFKITDNGSLAKASAISVVFTK